MFLVCENATISKHVECVCVCVCVGAQRIPILIKAFGSNGGDGNYATASTKHSSSRLRIHQEWVSAISLNSHARIPKKAMNNTGIGREYEENDMQQRQILDKRIDCYRECVSRMISL